MKLISQNHIFCDAPQSAFVFRSILSKMRVLYGSLPSLIRSIIICPGTLATMPSRFEGTIHHSPRLLPHRRPSCSKLSFPFLRIFIRASCHALENMIY